MTEISGNSALFEPVVTVPSKAAKYRVFDIESLVLIFFSAVIFIAYAAGLDVPVFWDTLVPLAIIVTLGWGALRMYSINPASTITSVFWFRATCLLYLGIGGMYRVIGSPDTINTINTFYNSIEADIQKTALVVFLSITVTIVTSKIFHGHMQADNKQAGLGNLTWSIPLGLGALTLGFWVRLSSYIVAETGVPTPVSAFYMFAGFTYIGTLLLADAGRRGNTKFAIIALAAMVVDTICGVLSAGKSQIIMPTIFFSIPFLLSSNSIRRLLLVGTGVGLLYIWSASYVPWARAEMEVRFGTIADISLPDRISVVDEYFDSFEDYTESSNYQYWLGRLSYVPAQSFAIRSYDSGAAGNTLENLPWVVVPRFLAHDKPIMTDVGLDFNQAITGRRNSQSLPSIVAEGYYVDGWFGVFFWMSMYGAILGLYSRFGVWVVSNGKFIYLPACLFCVWTGMRPDGSLIADVFGAAVIVSFLIAGAALVNYLVSLIWGGQRQAFEGS